MAKIAILGFGTVGSGVLEVLDKNAAGIARRAGQKIEVKYILDIRDFSAHPKAELFVNSIDPILEDPEVSTVVETIDRNESHYHPLYPLDLTVEEKIEAIAKNIYGADGVQYTTAAETQIRRLSELGFDKLPVCMAKTQYSLSDNPKALGRPEGFDITVREVTVSAGAGFIVALTGSIMTMPGLPKNPAANNMDISSDGTVVGLF